MEVIGFEPTTFRVQGGRSPIELYPRLIYYNLKMDFSKHCFTLLLEISYNNSEIINKKDLLKRFQMNIILVNQFDVYGGAEKIVYQLAQFYRTCGHRVCLVVSFKFSTDKIVVEIQNNRIKIFQKFLYLIDQYYSRQDIIKKILRVFQSNGIIKLLTGREKYGITDIQKMVNLAGFIPDIIHFHNLRGRHLGPSLIHSAGTSFPVIITLHDMWLITGKCIQPGMCDKWKDNCFPCPQSLSFLPVKRGISRNLQEKIYFISKAKPYICTPSKWLMDIVRNSYLANIASGFYIINNGVNLENFKPGDKKIAREKLGLHADCNIILSSGRDIKTNRYKNFSALRTVAKQLSEMDVKKPVIFLCLGDRGKSEFYKNIEIRFVPFTRDEKVIADYYCAADIYLSTSICETWGLTVSEAMACGTPVVGFSSGGLTEQIIHGENGFLVDCFDIKKMAESIFILLTNHQIREGMALKAAEHARKFFNIENTASKYLDVYENILATRDRKKT